MKPSSKPKASRAIVLKHAQKEWSKAKMPGSLPEFFLFAVRGYYRDTMGKPGVNDRGLYDDAFFVVGPETFASFNANTDPSRYKPGMATVMTGWHLYRPGKHGITRPGGGYPAFRPATKNEELPVTRDGESASPSKRPGVATNIHKGGYNTTSSEGCLTIPPDQWPAFHALVTLERKKHDVPSFWVGLIDGPIA